MPVDLLELDPDPLRQLGAWVDDAARAGAPLPEAFALATADGDGIPSVRFVLLHGLDFEGMRYYTNRSSRKGRDVAVNPWASGVFWWPVLDRQARVAGPVRTLPEAASQAYWVTRPRGSQLSAAVSQQGQEIATRADLDARVAEMSERYPDAIPLPDQWGGYLLIPHLVEFWESRPDRLHQC